uniref:Phosphatidylinositol 5-phosphate 4-kinase type-2 gamma n=1 Tax=Accipiter nisus TaxID=211598 RepID=A0A8B9NIX3_9AVES
MAAAAAATGPAAPRTKTKKKQKRFVPQRVKVPRAADPLLAVLAWGVNHQISELSQVPLPVMLLPDDFKASSKIKVNNHLFNRENLPSHFKFKEYCPQVFRNLRERFGIDDQDYQVSLTRSPPHWEGSDRRFLLSSDRTLVVKELSSEDVADVHGLLSHYHQYVVQCHGSTLLPRFLGMYRVSVDSEETYLLVMRNMFSHRLPVHRKYDLKGSLVSREASDKEKGKDLPTLKDMDFLNKNEKVYVGEEDQKEFMEKLKRDVEFLVQLKIMDYSLLLGIHEVGRAEQEEEEEVEEEEGGGGDEGWRPLGPSPELGVVDQGAEGGSEGGRFALQPRRAGSGHGLPWGGRRRKAAQAGGRLAGLGRPQGGGRCAVRHGALLGKPGRQHRDQAARLSGRQREGERGGGAVKRRSPPLLPRRLWLGVCQMG